MIPRPADGRRRWWPFSLIALLVIDTDPTAGQPAMVGPPVISLGDPRLAPLRAAAARWEARRGPERVVVDQVCLVPDLAGFLAATAGWDRTRFYPILIEDAESTLRFLRAFRPARIIRPTRPAPPIPPGQTWTAALESSRRTWIKASPDMPAGGDQGQPSAPGSSTPAPARPGPPGQTPPGVVLSNPDAPMLAGAVALAAGRFQPLVRFDAVAVQGQALALADFRHLDEALGRAVADAVPDCRSLGDDCDFLTLAGPYPDRYRDDRGEIGAVDDATARSPTGARWAYAGRLLGDPASSVYRAMCSLFLQPDSVTWFNGYDEAAPPWSAYSTRGAARRLAGSLATRTRQTGDRSAGVADWYEAFSPLNRSGLVWINSHGSPTVFHLQDNEQASTADVPRTVPSAVVMIHSFSAADPTDPATIAGRWLANGAFIYFGSIYEPYLQAFRTPQLASDLLADHLPMAAALRAVPGEPFGHPWRLSYLGDPLYRIEPPPAGTDSSRPRRVAPGPVDDGYAVLEPADPARAVAGLTARPTSESVLRSGVDAALLIAASAGSAGVNPPIADMIDLDRDSLPFDRRRVCDSIVADYLFANRRRAELRFRIESIPPLERSPELRRWLDALQAADFAWTLASDDFGRIVAAWSRIVRSDASADYREQATTRVGSRADAPDRRVEWTRALHAALGACPDSAAIVAELKRVEAAIAQDRPGPAGLP